MKIHTVNLVPAVVLVTLLCAAVAVAQTPNAVVSGTVLDSTGAVVPGAAISITNTATNVVSRSTSNSAGVFTVPNLLPGHYVLAVTKEGFKKVQIPAFELQVNQTLNEKITMPVGSTSESVEVSASSVGAMLQSATTELGTTIDSTQVEELPLNGRSFTQLLTLQPGVSQVDTSQGNSNGNTGVGSADGGNIGIPNTVVIKPSVNGSGNRSNAWYMDGIINTDDRGGAWSVPPIADSIQEFKVQSHNNDAQYGNVLGSVVNIVTKSGTNEFHGSAWDFARNNIFDARDPFKDFCTPTTCAALASRLNAQVASGGLTAAAAANTLSTTPAPPVGFSQNEFGGSIGGPIRKDKTFFYFAYEGWRYSQNNQSFVKVPSPEELSGDFSGTISPELIGQVNGTKTAITPAQIFNPFAESKTKTSVPFYCDASGAPMPLANPGFAFGQPGYGAQVTGGTPCNRIPAGLIDQNLAKVIAAYTGPELKNCAFTPNYTFAVDNCLDTRPSINNANNFDFRVDQHFGPNNTVFARAYMLWDTNNGIVAGTTSITPSPYHVWNIGGAWDHIFNPSLIMELRGGVNLRPDQVNATNPQGYTPETQAGFNNLKATAGFFLDVASYIGGSNNGIGNTGTELRDNPEHNFSGAMTWTHGRHTFKFGGEYVYESRLEINTYGRFVSATSQTCPVSSKTGSFACGSNQGNALASMLLDLPSQLVVNVPQNEEVHVKMTPIGGFFQDEWRVTPTLTLDLGLRYDYDPAVSLITSHGQTINALDLPNHQYIIGAASSDAYTTGCGTPEQPPCVPGGLNASNPAFQVTVGGVTYNTLNNIVFKPGTPALKAIRDNIGPRVGIAWQFMHNTVLRMGYGIFYDPIAYRSQYAENTLQGSVWPSTRGVADSLNSAPIGTAPAPTVNPICNSAATCGPYGGYTTSQLTGLTGSNPVVVAPTPWGSTFGGYTNDPNYTDPRSQQWNLQVQREITPTMMASVAYVGSKTQRLEWCCNANYPQGGPFCQNNPNAGFTCPSTPLTAAQISQTEYMPFAAQGWHYSESTGWANYNSLQAQFQKRFTMGLQTLVAFTWSKCLSDTAGDFNAENGKLGNPNEYFFSPLLAKGVCAFDIPRIFNWSGVYQLPFGKGKKWMQGGPLSWVAGNWQMSFNFLKRSGLAYNPTWGGASGACTTTVTTGCVPLSIAGEAPSSNDPANLSNAAGNITGYSRPSVIPGCDLTANQSANQWFNPACFVSPSSLLVGPGYGFGNSGVGILRSMGYWNVDFGLSKNIPIGERKHIQLRAEAFNVFNHMVLNSPSNGISPKIDSSTGAITYGSAGVVDSIANRPRQLQFAARFVF